MAEFDWARGDAFEGNSWSNGRHSLPVFREPFHLFLQPVRTFGDPTRDSTHLVASEARNSRYERFSSIERRCQSAT